MAEFKTLYGGRSKLCNVNLELKQILVYNVKTKVAHLGQIFVHTNLIFFIDKRLQYTEEARRLL